MVARREEIWLLLHEGIRPCDAKRKRCGALESCFGLVGPHQQSILQLFSLASRVYKGYQERSTCGSELMRGESCKSHEIC